MGCSVHLIEIYLAIKGQWGRSFLLLLALTSEVEQSQVTSDLRRHIAHVTSM